MISFSTGKKAFALLIFFLVSTAAIAQPYSVKVKLVDSKTKEPVAFATVSVAKTGSTNVDKYAQTDENGVATVKNIKPGKYTIEGILLGYENYTEEITVNKDLDLGEKKMKVQVNFLDGATVSDVGNPIVVKKDTIEHNVAIMKTTDSDMLEDLLKRLPGIEVGTDGSITANGKTISKVFVDGKAFFLDDPQLASKNLPAKIVNKVRVVEKKSEQAEFTGIDDGEEETVLDLNIKKGMMNGWMGNATGGLGTDLHSRSEVDKNGNMLKNDMRFQGGGMLARFTDSDQLVFIGNANNTNNRGFNDITGNQMGGMRGRGMRGGNNGISTSYMIGVNGGKMYPDKSELNGNYLFNGNERAVEEMTDRTTFRKDDDDLHSTEESVNLSNTYGHRVGARIDWKINKKSSFFWMPQFNYGWGNFSEDSKYTTGNILANGQEQAVNDGRSISSGNNLNKSANGRMMWRQRIGSKQGRTASLMINYNFSDNQIDGINQSTTNVYSAENDSVAIVDQHYLQSSKSLRLGGRFSYTEPLGKNFFAELNYGYTYSKSNSSKDTKDKDIAGNYTIDDIMYSNSIDNKYINQRAGISLKKQEKKYNATVGAQYQPSHTENLTISNGIERPYVRDVYNWAPNARIDLNFSDYNMLRLRYRGQTNQPSVNQLQPVPDNSDPQRITLGNPGLEPSFTHNVSSEYRFTNMKNYASFNCNLNFSYNANNIVNASWYDKGGIQYTVPVNNPKGTKSTNLFVMFNSPIAKSKFSIMSFTMGNLNMGVNMVGSADIDPDNEDARTDVKNFTNNEYTSVSASQNLRLVYRNDILECSLGGNVRYNQAWYSITTQNVKATFNNTLEGRIIAKIPNVLDISTNARYTFYEGYAQGYNEPVLRWDANISKQIFNNHATIALRMYDILNQSRQTSRTLTDNYDLYRTNNTLGRYFVLTFTYRFGKFGQKGNQMPMGGPMGGGRGPGMGGGRPGMGGPMGGPGMGGRH